MGRCLWKGDTLMMKELKEGGPRPRSAGNLPLHEVPAISLSTECRQSPSPRWRLSRPSDGPPTLFLPRPSLFLFQSKLTSEDFE